MGKKKTILVAPLHWGLGHATRCIPIINSLLNSNFNVIIASDGATLLLLQQEFPKLTSIELPSNNITYPKKGGHFKWKLFRNTLRILKVFYLEKKIIKNLVSEGRIDGIISDNRFGVQSNKVPSIYMTHQLQVLTGATSVISSYIHQRIIKKFTECWVPDSDGSNNLSGKMSHLKNTSLKIKYIGVLSRLKKMELQIKYDILIILSGPEPQRSLLEEKIMQVFRWEKQTILLIQGCVSSQQEIVQLGPMTIYNYMNSKELEKTINQSELVISRSGYTTIMDLAALNKKAFFIPTPGQFEQEYLAERMKELNKAPFCMQDDFSLEKLKEIANYNGLSSKKVNIGFEELFKLFQE